MSAPNDGGPAFPVGDGHGHRLQGMSLRDYFAAAALQGMLATGKVWPINLASDIPLSCQAEFAQAESAYALADAMLTERTRKEAQP